MSHPPTHAGPGGLVLGSYRILDELSSGGMGSVFRAQHVLLGRPAAVKLLRRDLSSSPALMQRFANEARAVTACKHPGIVEVYDFGHTDDGHAFIAMELLEGESLGHRLARVRLAEVEAAAIALGIASALKAAHRVGVIHRDLKPDNVFLVPDPDGGADRPKVLDFGIAKLADGTSGPGIGQTQTGALIGTPLYMAPEQARAAAAIDHRADLYSLGCILYHMLTGRPPFVAEGAGEIIALQMFCDVVPPSRLAPVSPEMDRLVLRLLAKEPGERFASAGELVGALQRLDQRPTRRMTRAEPIAAQDATTEQTAVPRRSRGWRIGALVIGALVIGASVAIVVMRDDGEAPAVPTATAPTAPAPTAPAPAPTAPPTAAAAPISPAPTEPAAPPTATATGPAAPPTAPAPGRKHPTHKISPGVGAITSSGGRGLPSQTIEVHRGTGDAARPPPGDHTAQGAPIEDTVDIDSRSRGSGAARASSPPSQPTQKTPPSPRTP